MHNSKSQEANKQAIIAYTQSMYMGDFVKAKRLADDLFAHGCTLQLCFPFETLDDISHLFQIYDTLLNAIPDLERRDTIVISNATEKGDEWVGCCGYYTGVMVNDWLDIPATGRMISMRYHEFYRFIDGKIIEMQAIWDIPELMIQANAWPLAPSLGREWHVPGPATQDGISTEPLNPDLSAKAARIVIDMCTDLGNHAAGGPKAMRLPNYWHERCSWYGPSGIGTARGLHGFRHWHQIPFLNALPDRDGNPEHGHMFADNNYVGYTAWPGMFMTVSDDGWLGIVPNGKRISMRSLDFWRVEGDKIRENWVLIDLLSVYDQLGLDVFARLREFNKARNYSQQLDVDL